MFPGANPSIAILLVGIFSTIAMVAYGMLGSAMPRSGGDYVFQSRVLHGAIGFLTAESNMVIWNWFYSYSAAMTIIYGMLSPLLNYLGFLLKNDTLTGLGTWMTNPLTVAGLSIVLIIAATLVMYRGIKPFVLIQRYFFGPAALLSLVVMAALLLYGSAFVTNFNAFTAAFRAAPPGGWYSGVIKAAVDLGYNPYPAFSWWDTLALACVASPAFMYVGVTTALLGEIKGSESLKTNVNMLVGACLITFAVYLIAFAGMLHVMGMPFMSSIGFLSFEHPDLLPLPTFIFLPLPGYMLISFLSLNPLIAFLIGLGFLGVIGQCLFNSPIGSTRVMFASAMDRILPESVSFVNKYGTPWNALLVTQAAAIVFALVLTSFLGLAGYLAGSALSGAVMFSGTLLAALLFPYSAKGIYNLAPASKYKIGGIPVITLVGGIALAWTVLMAYVNLATPAFGIRGIPLYFALGMYVVLAVYYYGAKLYRKRQGIDLELAFREVPPA